MVNVLSLRSLRINIVGKADRAGGDLGQLGIDVESKSAELADVHRVAAAEGVVQVGNEASPDNQHLPAEIKSYTIKMLTCDLASRGFWFALVLSVGVLCLPGYLSPFFRILNPAKTVEHTPN